jgi:CubicO group peptidase (beta-lactamase class C family)
MPYINNKKSAKIIHSLFWGHGSETMAYKAKMACMKVILIYSVLLFLQPAGAQYNWSALDRKLKDNRQLLGNNVVCLVANKDSLLFKKEMGDFNSTTVAPIASCSKWLTAALVMQLVDEGKFSLDDKVSKYLPGFGKNGKEELTIRQCLCHMTGIADEKNFLKRIMGRRKYASLEEEVNSFAAAGVRSAPGQDFFYGNIGLNIAGRIVEVISGKKFEDIVKEKLFDPLEMSKSSFAATRGGGPVNPSGGARSTADDYMKFLYMLLNNGVYKGKKILSQAAVEVMKEVQNTPEQIQYAPKAAEGYTYALGSWVVEDETTTGKIYNPDKPEMEFARMPKTVASALASPGLFGTWPMVDWCRGYVYIVFVKNLLGEQRAEVHKNMKKIIDEQIISRRR